MTSLDPALVGCSVSLDSHVSCLAKGRLVLRSRQAAHIDLIPDHEGADDNQNAQ